MIDPGPGFPLLTAFLLGLRHGIDWDHIAAITDVTAAPSTTRRGVLLGTMYATGHALVVIVIGTLSVLFGVELPNWVAGYMEPVVGATLILLGLWVLYSLLRGPERFRLRSRWMLVWDGIRAGVGWLRHGHAHASVRPRGDTPGYGYSATFLVGIIHGFGAETPTQVLLFVSLTSAAGAALGVLLIAAFVLGLFISNTGISLGSVFGFVSSRGDRRFYLGMSAVTGVMSLVVGMLVVTGHAGLLPVLSGG